jgi:hypothetical protein
MSVKHRQGINISRDDTLFTARSQPCYTEQLHDLRASVPPRSHQARGTTEHTIFAFLSHIALLLLARSARSSLKQARVVNGEVVIRTL